MRTLIFAFLLVACVPFAAMANGSARNQNDADRDLKFKGGIAVDPVLNIAAMTGLPNSNTVCGVPPGATPWRIGSLQAEVDADGRIKVKGRGLLVAGGNSIGTNAGQTVQAELFCNVPMGTCGTPSFTSPTGVPLAADGDFEIKDTLSPIPPVPCTNPVLLITQIPAKGGRWFVAGIPASK
jgi:hypothetical protein